MSFQESGHLSLRRAFRGMLVLVGLSVLPLGGQAYVTTITAGAKSIFLEVGTGTITGGNYSSGGTPANNATVNSVSVNIPAANVGAGSVAMTTNSPVTASPWDGFTFCTVPAQVYVGGFYRAPGAGASATLTVTSPTSLFSGGDAIAFSNISWISSGIGDATPTIPSGTFAAGSSNTLLSVATNTWFESCLQFNYSNAAVVPAGTFTGRVTYTLTAP